MAYFEKLGNNKWLVKFYCKDHKGNNKQIKKQGFNTKKDAQEYVNTYKQTHSNVENITIEYLISDFLKFKNYTKHNTIKVNKMIFKKILNHFGNDFLITNFTTKNILDFLMLHKDTKNIQKKLFVKFKSLLDYACIYFNLSNNPIQKIKLEIKKEFKEKNILTIEEFKKLDNYFSSTKHKKNIKTRAYFNLLYYSGARPGEIAALTLNDIDFNNNTISINKTRINSNDANTPKNKTSIRLISIPFDTMKILKEYTNQLPAINDFFIFSIVYSYEALLKKYTEKFNLPKITLHSFRHSHASLLIKKGIAITDISKRLGHATPNTTLSVYSHFYKESKDNVIDMLNNL